MRLRYLLVLAPLLATPDATLGTPIDLCALPAQEVIKKAKALAILRAQPSSAADSIGFFAKDAELTVVACALGWCEVRSPLVTGFLLDSLLVEIPATPLPDARPTPAPTPPPAPRRACCRVCTTGKACGNSCIARDRNCRQPQGCACNGGEGGSGELVSARPDRP